MAPRPMSTKRSSHSHRDERSRRSSRHPQASSSHTTTDSRRSVTQRSRQASAQGENNDGGRSTAASYAGQLWDALDANSSSGLTAPSDERLTVSQKNYLMAKVERALEHSNMPAGQQGLLKNKARNATREGWLSAMNIATPTPASNQLPMRSAHNHGASATGSRRVGGRRESRGTERSGMSVKQKGGSTLGKRRGNNK